MTLDFLKFVTSGLFLGIVTLGVIAKRGFPGEMPLYFLKFVTDRRFQGIVPLGDFRKARIFREHDIIFFEVCNKEAVFGNRDIK